MSLLVFLFSLPLFALASPSGHVRRQFDITVHCGTWDSVTTGPYSINLDQWGATGATSGESCARWISLSGTTASWVNNWTWTGGTGVKSYTDLQLNEGINQQLSAIRSMPSKWSWSQSTSGSIVANVAYDFFTSTSFSGSASNEIMIWLANFNAGPISSVYGSDGLPTPIASSISIAGNSWNLYQGSNGANNVFSFLPSSSGTEITNFSGDIFGFFDYLISNENLPSSQYLTTAQAGSEATSGTATLTTTAYSLSIE
ncbi:family 12 glycoside hydrolase [Heterobasidion irregulare TC 32-1]|uniref:Family 12 glycoside hydrolase n=1 Tax=Heterobasidion irregulare (strain TC 32-1) TaxID=747525 RepID=W4JPZ8_HETIT|nr:family 12 glycoside hydrolase [Heterobasidion irregulare TC 32-1]ETW75160.1 family 12 glycoside hydrolase [Heterobasidion irregulare TC 32-1]